VPELTSDETKLILPVLETEYQTRKTRQIRYLLQRSGMKRIKRFEDFDWAFNPKLPREKITAFRSSPWIEEAKNLVCIGPTGVGKSHLAYSFCYEAIQKGVPTAVITCYDFVGKLKRAGNKHALLQHYSMVKVLCIDELGYVFPSQEEANDLFQIISKRSELLPTIMTTNLMPSQWGKIFEASTATAILDRLSLKGTFLTFEGKSYRSRG
jgi:DNA replication protein DnaC